MRRIFFLAVITLVCVSGLCAQSSTKTSSKQSKDERAIRGILDSTADGWNKGILPQYLAPYTKDATEMLKGGPTGGVDAIEKTMREGFWKTGRPVQQLRYEHVWVRMLGPGGAVVTGQYVLTGGGVPERSGWFTTAWLKTRGGWKMIHDHS